MIRYTDPSDLYRSLEVCGKCKGAGKYTSFFGKVKKCSKCNGFGIFEIAISYNNSSIHEFKFIKKPRFVYNYGRKTWLRPSNNKLVLAMQGNRRK